MGKWSDYLSKAAIVAADIFAIIDSVTGTNKKITAKEIEEFVHANVDRASMYAAAPVITTLTNAGQYYKLTSANLTSGTLANFTFLNGVFTFTGEDGTDFLFLGDANVETDKACELTFALYVNGVVVTGEDGTDFLFLLDANVETDKACELTFALYVNGVVVTGGTTPIDIAAVSKKESMGINIPVQLNNGDTVEVWAKSDIAITALTVKTITTTLWR